MKKTFLFSLFCAFLSLAHPEETITLSGAWALYPMAVKWAEEYQKLHPDIKIEVVAGGAGKGITDALSGMVDLGMVSRDLKKEEADKGAYDIAVTKDAVIVTMNAENPFSREILTKGLKKENFIDIWISEKTASWGQIFGGKTEIPLRKYTRSDACGAAEIWAKYLGKKQEDLKGTGVYGDPGIAEAVKKDVCGIGYNNVNFAYDQTTKKPFAGLCIVPIDLNGNGKLDSEENFYGTREELMTAIADGKYPSPPARKLFLVSKGKPSRKSVADFLKWILTEGQKFVPETGYIGLPKADLSANLKKLE